MVHYVYKIENPETGRYYFGSRSFNGNPKEDTYMGSMKTWKPNKNKLVKLIIKDDFNNREEAIEFESNIIEKYIDDELNENYNIPTKGFHTHGTTLSTEHKRKLSESHIGLFSGENHPMYGKNHSKETRKKMSNSLKGRIFTEEWRKNISKSCGGRKAWNEGLILSKETRKRMSEARKGMTFTEEHKKKISESRKGEKHPLYRKFGGKNPTSKKILQYTKDGIFIKEWDAIITAANSLGLNKAHISACCRGKRNIHGNFIWKFKNKK